MKLEIRWATPLLQVFDMPTSIAFYRDVLGFTIGGTDGKTVPDNDWVLLEREGVYLMLNTAYERDHRPAAPDPKRVAAHRDVCLYLACPDVDAAYAYLRDKEIKMDAPKVAPYGMKQLYLRDPDGYNLCFQWKADAMASGSGAE